MISNLSGATRWGLNGVLLLSMVVALYLGKTILIPTIIALLLAAMLWPAAQWLKEGVQVPLPGRRNQFPWLMPYLVKIQVPWGMACITMVSLLIVVTLLVPLGLGLAVPKMLQDFPKDEDKQEDLYRQLRTKITQVSPIPLAEDFYPVDPKKSYLFDSVRTALDPKSGVIISVLLQVASYSGGFIWEGMLIMFILLFLLLEGPMLTRRVVEIFGPSKEAQDKAVGALKDMARQVRTYLVWRTIVNFGFGMLLGLVYKWVGLRQPWTWALLTAVLWYIPYLGSISAGILPVVDAFIAKPHPGYAIAILGFYVLIITIEGYLIVPVMMGRPMQLNATTILLACLFWELVWGTPGLFLTMPLMAALKAICAHVPGWQPWANLMSTESGGLPPERPKIFKSDELFEETQMLGPEEEPSQVAAQ